MAQGSIRIVRDETPVSGGSIQGTSRATSKVGGITIKPEPSDSSSVPTVQQQSGNGESTRRKRHSETKRTSLSVEDRDGVTSEEVTPKVQPNRTTPAPESAAPKARVYSRSPKRYMAESESEQTAKFLLSAVEMVGVTVSGHIG